MQISVSLDARIFFDPFAKWQARGLQKCVIVRALWIMDFEGVDAKSPEE